MHWLVVTLWQKEINRAFFKPSLNFKPGLTKPGFCPAWYNLDWKPGLKTQFNKPGLVKPGLETQLGNPV
jgi:hypothetical protein